MRSAGAAIGWEFRRRHQWPLVAIGVYLVVLAAIKILGLGLVAHIRLIPPDERGAAVVAPVSTAYFYYLAVFSFGFAGDLASRQSIFPARMFALPVRTAALVGWPMLYGTGTVVLLCTAAALFVRWSWGIELPLIWPALLAAAFLAWTQALTWMPYGLPGLRVIVTVLWLAVLDAVVILAIHYNASEPLMIAILAPQLPLAYLVARFAVTRARRGDVSDWRGMFARSGAKANVLRTRRDAFASARRAQLWFEWRRHGRSLPGTVAILLPFELALLWLGKDAPAFVDLILVIVLLTPPLMAAFAATTYSKANPDVRDSYGVSAFIATRPLTSAALIAAKLKAAIRSTLAAWLLVVIAIPLSLSLSGTWPAVIGRLNRTIELVGTPRAIVFSLLLLSGLMVSTWKQLVQSMFIGLTGRAWIIRSSVLVALSFIVIVGPLAQWIDDHQNARAALWNSLPAILAVLATLKILAAAWIAARLSESRLLSDRTLVTGAVTWFVAVLALYALLSWLVSGPLIPRYFVLLLAILAIPLARLSAAPLALAWNRHR
jgi:hypothetical protein